MSATAQVEPASDEAGRKYRAFLLRCWQEAGAPAGGKPVWRFSLTEVGQEQSRKGFASLEELAAYLRRILSDAGTGV